MKTLRLIMIVILRICYNTIQYHFTHMTRGSEFAHMKSSDGKSCFTLQSHTWEGIVERIFAKSFDLLIV